MTPSVLFVAPSVTSMKLGLLFDGEATPKT
jgi:hypothetical protein